MKNEETVAVIVDGEPYWQTLRDYVLIPYRQNEHHCIKTQF